MVRLVFILAGASLLAARSRTAYLLCALLLFTGWKMAFAHDRQPDPHQDIAFRLVRRVMPTTSEYHGDTFFVRLAGRRTATLLFVALVAREATDLVFAVDSVAAVLAITTNTFMVGTLVVAIATSLFATRGGSPPDGPGGAPTAATASVVR